MAFDCIVGIGFYRHRESIFSVLMFTIVAVQAGLSSFC